MNQDRRSFLKTSSLALAAGMLQPSLGWASPTGSRPLIKKSLKYGMIKEDLSLLDKFLLVKDLGFDGVEMDSPNGFELKDILKARDKSGIELPGVVNSLHWKKPLSDPDPEVRKACTDSIIQALKDTKEMGGTTVLVVPGVVKEQVSYQQAWDRSIEEIKKVLPTAEKTGVKLALENVWNNFLLSPVEALHYLNQFDSDMIGWYLDVGNLLRYGWPLHWVEILQHRILKIDIKEYSLKKMRDEGIWKGFQVELTEGDVDWPGLNWGLAEVGYQGWGSAEVPGGDRKRLAKISELMDKIYAS
ncbi:MAG: sugar phosphate isomerase/epimerase family protein [Bacteroidota bacterium]